MTQRDLETHLNHIYSAFGTNPDLLPTTSIFPAELDYKSTDLMLGIDIAPFASSSAVESEEVPIVDFGPKGIMRCDFCKSYMNPFNLFMQNNKYYMCAFCCSVNPVPSHYSPGKQLETLSFHIRPSQHEFRVQDIRDSPYLALVIQNSYVFAQTDAYQNAITAIKISLDSIDPKQKIIVFTYNQQSVQFYDMRSSEPTCYHLLAGQIPLPCAGSPLEDCKEKLVQLLEYLPSAVKLIPTKRETLAKQAMEFAVAAMLNIGGRVIHILYNERKQVRKEEPPTTTQASLQWKLFSESPYFGHMAGLCLKHWTSYNMLIVTDFATNFVSLAEVCRRSNGEISTYQLSESHSIKLYYDLIRLLTQPYKYMCSNRARFNSSIKTTEAPKKPSDPPYSLATEWRLSYLSNLTQGLNNFCALPPDHRFCMNVELMANTNRKYFLLQNSILYTLPDGRKQLTITHLIVPLKSSVQDVLNGVDINTMRVYFLRKSIFECIREKEMRVFREKVRKACKAITRLKKTPWSAQLLMTGLALLKNRIFSSITKLTDLKEIQNRWQTIIKCSLYNDAMLTKELQPLIYRIHPQGEEEETPISMSFENIQNGYYYILDKAETIYVYIPEGSELTLEEAQEIFEDPDNRLGWFVAQLRLEKPSGFGRVVYIQSQNQDDRVMEFMNSLVLSQGCYEVTESWEQFMTSLVGF